MSQNERSGSRTGVERLVGFSDGVFAIAITLLVLSIEIPSGTDSAFRVISAERTDVLTYVISFLVIGKYWIEHHHMFERVVRQDDRLLWLNLLFLLCIAFVPFPTALLGDTISTATVSVYAFTLVLTDLLAASSWWYATGPGELTDHPTTSVQRRAHIIRMLAPTAVLVVSILVAMFRPVWGMYCWFALALVDPVLHRAFPGLFPAEADE